MTTVAELGPHSSIPVSPIPAVNVATVPQRSPLRYPGGKTWLVPHVRAWLETIGPPELLIEPFAGGAITSLTSVMEGLAERCLMVELDHDVAAFWQAALQHSDELIDKVDRFVPTRHEVQRLAEHTPNSVVERGFRTLVLNRTRRGGILADGASLPRNGENGRGVASRWYPDTIKRRLETIAEYAHRIDFYEGDGVAKLETVLAVKRHILTAVFVDPPYTDGGKRTGRRLYNHNSIDHARLFALLADSGATFLMTYDESPEILRLVTRHGFHAVSVLMKNTHHAKQSELVITNREVFSQ